MCVHVIRDKGIEVYCCNSKCSCNAEFGQFSVGIPGGRWVGGSMHTRCRCWGACMESPSVVPAVVGVGVVVPAVVVRLVVLARVQLVVLLWTLGDVLRSLGDLLWSGLLGLERGKV